MEHAELGLGGPGGVIDPTDIARGYSYVATYTLQDNYGNPYPPSDSAPYVITVSVSPSKLADAGACFSFAAQAATLLALAPFSGPAGPWLLAGAATAGTVSAGFYAAANDPPIPDPAFRTEVLLISSYIEDLLPTDSPMPELRAFLVHSLRTIKIIDAIGQVTGKILGARQAEDPLAEAAQTAARSRLQDQLRSEFHLAVASSQAAAEEMNSVVDAAQLEARLHIIGIDGISPDMRRNFDEKFDSITRTMVEALLTPGRVELIKPPVGDYVMAAASNLAVAAQMVMASEDPEPES